MSSPNPSHITYSSEKVIWTIVAKNNGSTPYNSDVKVALSWNHPVNYLRVSSDTDGMQGVQFGDGSAVGTVFNRTTSVWNVGPLSVGQEKRLYVETSFDELQNLDNLLPLILTKTLTLDSGNIPNNVHVVSSDVLRKGVIPLPNEVDCSKVRYGPPGPPGPQGLDAYLVAVSNGYVGSLDSWLLTLVGPQGEQGEQGIPGESGLEENLTIVERDALVPPDLYNGKQIYCTDCIASNGQIGAKQFYQSSTSSWLTFVTF